MKLVTKLLTGVLLISGIGFSNIGVTDDQSASAASSKTIGTKKAKQIALKAAHGGKVTDIHLEKDDGRKKYEVEVIKKKIEYDFDIDAVTGKILEMDKDVMDDDDYSYSKI